MCGSRIAVIAFGVLVAKLIRRDLSAFENKAVKGFNERQPIDLCLEGQRCRAGGNNRQQKVELLCAQMIGKIEIADAVKIRARGADALLNLMDDILVLSFLGPG